MPEEKNTVFIGSKNFGNYLNAVQTQINNGEKQITVKARGRWISRAFDIALNQMFQNIFEVKDIKAYSETVENKEKKTVRISSVEILLKKKRE